MRQNKNPAPGAEAPAAGRENLTYYTALRNRSAAADGEFLHRKAATIPFQPKEVASAALLAPRISELMGGHNNRLVASGANLVDSVAGGAGAFHQILHQVVEVIARHGVAELIFDLDQNSASGIDHLTKRPDAASLESFDNVIDRSVQFVSVPVAAVVVAPAARSAVPAGIVAPTAASAPAAAPASVIDWPVVVAFSAA